jgi:transposase-like protein
MTHKSEDYKLSTVKYYLKNKDNIRKTCKIFDCRKSILHGWIHGLSSGLYEPIKSKFIRSTKGNPC